MCAHTFVLSKHTWILQSLEKKNPVVRNECHVGRISKRMTPTKTAAARTSEWGQNCRHAIYRGMC